MHIQFPDPSKIGSLLTRQIAETVQWQRCIESAKNMGVNNWIVVGPAKVLGNLLKKEYPDDTIISISTVEDIAEYGEKLKFQGSSNK
jgi:[acyl-carrier-protein] S-malonyltransferase